MKLNYKLKVCLMVFAFSFIGNSAIATNNFKSEITSESSEDWIEVLNENGITVFLKEYQENNQTYLDVKFENKTDREITFSWTLSKKGEKVLAASSYSINPNGSMGRSDTSTLIQIAGNESIKDFSIIINQK